MVINAMKKSVLGKKYRKIHLEVVFYTERSAKVTRYCLTRWQGVRSEGSGVGQGAMWSKNTITGQRPSNPEGWSYLTCLKMEGDL